MTDLIFKGEMGDACLMRAQAAEQAEREDSARRSRRRKARDNQVEHFRYHRPSYGGAEGLQENHQGLGPRPRSEGRHRRQDNGLSARVDAASQQSDALKSGTAEVAASTVPINLKELTCLHE